MTIACTPLPTLKSGILLAFALIGAAAPASTLACTPPAATDRAEVGAPRADLLVFAAISLRECLREAADRFAVRRPDVDLSIHTAASGLLSRQIEQGAPADLFLSADADEVDRLEAAGSLRAGSRATIASNALVIVLPRGDQPPARFEDLLDPRFDRISIGNPRTVPAGRYADQALRSLGLRAALESRLIPGENVRQVLEYVVRGETAAGIVYLTEALNAADAIVIGPGPPDGAHAAILYQAAVPSGAARPAEAFAFIDYLRSGAGQSILARYGFLPPPAP